jgi:hypothetical protein
MATRMQQRRSPASDWSTANPILAAGEIGYEIDTNKFKIGDGINYWADLTYFDNADNIGGSLGDYVPLSQKGADNGVATLDSTGNVPFSQLGNIIDGAPGVLDTLNEIAAAIGDDASFITTLATSIGTKQDKVTGVSDTEIGYLDGVTSAIQTQLDSKLASANLTEAAQDAVNTAIVAGIGLNKTYDDASNTITIDADLAEYGGLYLDNDGKLAADGYYITYNAGTQELRNKTIYTQYNDIVVAVSDIEDVTVSAAELNVLDGITASTTELNYVDGVTSSIQTQLDSKLASSTASSTYATISNVNLKAPLESPALTGTPTAPTATAGTNTTQVATTAFVTTAVNNVIDSAPGALDTLNELAAALGDDANYAATITTALGNKQDKVANVSDAEIGYLDGVTSAIQTQINAKAPTASPTLTGTPLAPTATAGTNTTQIATTAFVKTAIDAVSTSDIEEGTNLYFTDQRAVDAVTYAITHGLNVTLDGGTP